MKFFLLTIIGLSSVFVPSFAEDSQFGYSKTRTCTRNEYREQYFPGTRNNPGYIEKWEETVEVPCGPNNSKGKNRKTDQNDCSEGTVAGGILGGGLATAVSRGKDRWWAIPAGIISGSMVGCQVDGG